MHGGEATLLTMHLKHQDAKISHLMRAKHQAVIIKFQLHALAVAKVIKSVS